MRYFYGVRKKYGLYRGVVFYYSNIDEDEILVYQSREAYDTSSDAYDDALAWAKEEGIKVEMEP